MTGPLSIAERRTAPTDDPVAPSPVVGEDHEATYTLATAGKDKN